MRPLSDLRRPQSRPRFLPIKCRKNTPCRKSPPILSFTTLTLFEIPPHLCIINSNTMKKKEFKTTIHAPRNLVWHVLWNTTTYRLWTAPFSEGVPGASEGFAVSDWNEKSEILFLTKEGGGMYSLIEKKEVPSYMAFKHLG